MEWLLNRMFLRYVYDYIGGDHDKILKELLATVSTFAITALWLGPCELVYIWSFFNCFGLNFELWVAKFFSISPFSTIEVRNINRETLHNHNQYPLYWPQRLCGRSIWSLSSCRFLWVKPCHVGSGVCSTLPISGPLSSTMFFPWTVWNLPSWLEEDWFSKVGKNTNEIPLVTYLIF